MSFVVHYGSPVYDLWINPKTQFVLSAFATVVLLYGLRNLSLFIWCFVQPGRLQQYCHSESGSWALVTGASDGIGRGFVDELLEHGFNVLLHGRNQEKLRRIRDELVQKHPRRTIDFVVADASSNDHPEDAVVEKVKNLPGKLVILVNNVGGIHGHPQFRRFDAVPPAEIDWQINTNARFPTQLTRAVLPLLLQNKPALILNCGSVGGTIGIPYLTAYTATKGYIHSFTQSLKTELVAEEQASEIEVMGFVIGNVLSAGNTGELWPFTITARQCARGCLARIGSGQTLAYAHWRHGVQIALMSALSERHRQKAIIPAMRKRKEEDEKSR